jgi:beta-lactamase class A
MRFTPILSRPVMGLLLAVGLFAAPLPGADAFGPAPASLAARTARARLLAELTRFSTLSDGTVGIAIQNLGTGETVEVNGHTLFPMASAYKVAVAGKILSMVDGGALSLDRIVAVDQAMMTSGGIADLLPHKGAALSVYNLLDLMMTRSDNSATDILVLLAGGPQAVDAWVKAAGVRDLRVDSNTAQLLYRAMGIAPKAGSFQANVQAALQADPVLRERDSRDLPNIAFAMDPRDTATPLAMNALIIALRTGKLLKPATTATLIAIMDRCQTGALRLKGMLPPGTGVAHKTGSLNGTGNDVGIITLPDGQMIAMSVFVMKDSKGHESRDRIIAEAARAAYDYFLFLPERRDDPKVAALPQFPHLG